MVFLTCIDSQGLTLSHTSGNALVAHSFCLFYGYCQITNFHQVNSTQKWSFLLVSCCHVNQWKVQSFCLGRIWWSSHSTSTWHRQVQHSCNPLERILYNYVYHWIWVIHIHTFVCILYGTRINIHGACIITSCSRCTMIFDRFLSHRIAGQWRHYHQSQLQAIYFAVQLCPLVAKWWMKKP